MGNFHWYFMGNMPWKYHEKSVKKPLKIQRFMAHEKTLTNKNPMKMPWNRMKPAYFFHGFLMIMKKPWIKKLFFHGVGIYGFFMGLLNSCPIKKPWFFRERSNINGSWKNEMAFDDIFITHELWPSLIFHGKDKDMATMKI